MVTNIVDSIQFGSPSIRSPIIAQFSIRLRLARVFEPPDNRDRIES